MFKNLIIYRIAPLWPADLPAIEEALTKAPFMECGATQEQSAGFVPPRGEEHGALVEAIDGQWILRFKSESKVLPGDVVARRVAEKADRIEQETGRKPGKKERKELKEEARLDLLPMAFTRQSCTWVWIDREARLLVIDTSSHGRADVIVSGLVELLPGLSVSLVHTELNPSSWMGAVLFDQRDNEFTVDRFCELKAPDESKATVRYNRHSLDLEEIHNHIRQGKACTKLGVTWDDRVSFVLTEGLQLRGVQFLDTVFDGQAADAGGFDTDVAIATGELRKLIPDLIQVLGGEPEAQEGGAA